MWRSASRRTEFSGGTPEIAREDACAPRTYPEIVASQFVRSSERMCEETGWQAIALRSARTREHSAGDSSTTKIGLRRKLSHRSDGRVSAYDRGKFVRGGLQDPLVSIGVHMGETKESRIAVVPLIIIGK